MTTERRVYRETTTDPEYTTRPAAQSTYVEKTEFAPSGGEMLRRGVILVFGIIQILIAARIVLLLLNAREGNDLVAFILNASQLFVAPFVGIFNSNALEAGGSVLDIAAVAAIVGWTLLEWIVLWAVNLTRREPV